MANTLAYYDTATITAVKSFIVQAPGYIARGGNYAKQDKWNWDLANLTKLFGIICATTGILS
jgi:hypothetical protein